MRKSISNYFEWNRALRLFFLDDSDLPVKLLCVDEEVLEIIGRKYHVNLQGASTYHEYFLKSVCLSNDDRNEMIRFWRDEMHCTISCLENASLFQIAYALSSIEVIDANAESLKLPCLALMSLFVLLCSNDNSPRREVIESLARLTGIDSGQEGRGFEHIPAILSAINRYDSLFDDSVRGARKNVGRLLHQRVLNQRESVLFKEFLYVYHVSFNETSFTSYEDLMNYSLLEKFTGRYSVLRDRVVRQRRFRNEEFFKRQIQCFDREKYREDFEDRHQRPKVIGSFFLVINCQYNYFSVYTDIGVDHDLQTDFGSIPRSCEETDGYYPTNIDIHSIDDYIGLSYEDEEYSISASKAGQCLFFEVSRNSLCQVYEQLPGHNYFIVCRPNDIRNLARRQTVINRTDSISAFFIHDPWSLFYVDSWQATNLGTVVRYESPIRNGLGIAVPGRSNVFFAQGLPVVISPDRISILLEKDIVTQGNTAIRREVTYRNGVSYIEIRNKPNLPEEVDELPIKVIIIDSVDTEHPNENRRKVIDSYKVFFPLIDGLEINAFQHLFSVDGWGRICINRNNEPQLYDNQISNKDILSLGTICTSKRRYVNTAPECSIRFISLLRAFYNKKGFMFRKDIDEIAFYLSGYYGLELDPKDKDKEFYLLRNSLVDLGFINRSYNENGSEIYQVASPKFFPTGKEFGLSKEYLLYGSYLESQVRNLCNLTPCYNYIRPYSDDDFKDHPIYALIPYYMIFALVDNQLERVRSWGITIEVASLSDVLFSMVKSPDSFEADFLTNANRRQNIADQAAVYPRVVGRRKNWQLEDGYFVYRDYIPDNRQYGRARIPYSLMQQYCQFRLNKPVLYSGNETIGFVNGMALPGLFRKGLAFINLGLPTCRYVFSLSGLFGDYLDYRFTEYNVPNEEHSVIASRLSGSNESSRMVQYELSNKLRFKMYYVERSAPETFIIQVVFVLNQTVVHTYAKKIDDTYVAFTRVNDVYFKLNYPTAREALAAVITEAEDINNHIDYSYRDTSGGGIPDQNGQIIKIIK